jgi:hypothetical protein
MCCQLCTGEAGSSRCSISAGFIIEDLSTTSPLFGVASHVLVTVRASTTNTCSLVELLVLNAAKLY